MFEKIKNIWRLSKQKTLDKAISDYLDYEFAFNMLMECLRRASEENNIEEMSFYAKEAGKTASKMSLKLKMMSWLVK